MNFLKTESLKRLTLYILSGMFLILLIEYIVLDSRIVVLEEVEEKKDFARSVQLEGQQIAFLVQEFKNGNKELEQDIAARLTRQEHNLKILGEGGRPDNSKTIFKPLSPLPKITHQYLSENWQRYQEQVSTVISPADFVSGASDSTIDSVSVNDSTATHLETTTNLATQAGNEPQLAAQWIIVAEWYEKLLADLNEEVVQKEDSVERWITAFVLFDLVLLASLFYFFWRFVLTPLRKLNANTVNHVQDYSFDKNEIGELATAINDILEQLKDATEFVGAIGEGKLDFDYKTLDAQYEQGRNRLADSLISMQGKLKTMNIEEQRRQWANEGLTKFVDILRSSNDNIQQLSDKIVSTLVKYTNSNQGGLYLLNDENRDERYLELISLFAFDIKKFEKQKVKLGEGILGQTFLEKETTVLTEIPGDYIRITSGLGDATPNSIMIVPLKVDDDVYGIVELASFKPYQPHEIAFVEKLAETIASTLASVKIGQKNKDLIEQFQHQAEQMHAQEEEMRQNMEELQATQEELARKEQDYVKRIHDLENQVKESVGNEQISAVKREALKREQELLEKIEALQQKLHERPDDWKVAQDISQTLRFQIEALKIATGKD